MKKGVSSFPIREQCKRQNNLRGFQQILSSGRQIQRLLISGDEAYIEPPLIPSYYIQIRQQMSIERDYDFFCAEDSSEPQQWEYANIGLMRQISLDPTEPIMLNLISIPPIQEPSTQPSWVDDYRPTDIETGSETVSNSAESNRRRREKDSNYEKNICAYITKKAVQCLLSADYRAAVKKLCAKHGCDFDQLQSYYGQRYKEVFGITHLTLLISPQTENELAMKKVFRLFLKWFLREKYMFYLLKYGKMSDKEKYVEFKNKYLLFIDEQIINIRTY